MQKSSSNLPQSSQNGKSGLQDYQPHCLLFSPLAQGSKEKGMEYSSCRSSGSCLKWKKCRMDHQNCVKPTSSPVPLPAPSSAHPIETHWRVDPWYRPSQWAPPAENWKLVTKFKPTTRAIYRGSGKFEIPSFTFPGSNNTIIICFLTWTTWQVLEKWFSLLCVSATTLC